jgi:hypothetical protein
VSGQPQECRDINCPMASIGHGFALPSGDFTKAKIVCLLETPATNEIQWPIKDLPDGQAEFARRRVQYPNLAPRNIEVGAAVVGKAGATLFSWMLEPLGIYRVDIGLVNTLHCYPGKKPDGTIAYPIGDIRKRAEACCSTLWWNVLREWKPSIAIICLHPAAISREPSPLPICLKAIEKAKHFSLQGEKVLIVMGGKAAKAWLGHSENTTIWCGHYEIESDYVRLKREERRRNGMVIIVGPKVPKPKKLTAKAALEIFLSASMPVTRSTVGGLDGQVITGEVCYHIDTYISEEQYAEMKMLLVNKSKVKKAKGEK